MIPILALVFVSLFLIIGGDRGVMSLMTLCGNLAIFSLSILFMVMGFHPIVVTLIASTAISSITLLYQNGKNIKSISALIAVVIIMLLLFIFTYIYGMQSHISGLNEIEQRSDFAMYYSFNINVNMELVAISMIIMGLIGAIMDTAIAVSSSIYEIHENNRHLAVDELFQSGITIGKDILGTTLNTLYFAYIGEALLLLLYMQQYHYSIVKLINSKAFLQDFMCIIFSAIGCVLIIPLSAFITSHLIIETSIHS